MSLGRFSFGPEIGYRIKEPGGSFYEPYLGLKGVWDFSRQDEVTIDGTPVAPETLRGRVEGGMVIKTENGLLVRGSAAYDGIGAKGYDAYQGRINVRVPVN